MAKVGTFLLFLFFSYRYGSNGMLHEETSPQFLFRSQNRQQRPPLEVVCVTSDYPLPLLDDQDQMLNKLCTRVLYRMPLMAKFSDWEYSLKHSDPIADYRERYPDIRFQVSIPDSFLTTTSPTEMPRLVAYLIKMQAGIDVMVDPNTDLGILYHTLMSFRDILPPGKQLSISLTDLSDPKELVDRGIIDAVNLIHIYPPYVLNESIFMRDTPVKFDLVKTIDRFIQAGIRSRMLIVGITSTISSNDINAEPFSVTTLTDVCDSMEFTNWDLQRIEKDQFVWANTENKESTYKSVMGGSIVDQVGTLLRMKIYGIGLFDLPFQRPVNPICLALKNSVIHSVHQGLNASLQGRSTSSVSVKVPKVNPEFKVIGGQLVGGGRLGKILFFSEQNEEENYMEYFNITDDNTLISSPIEHIILGYSDEDQVFNIYQPRCKNQAKDSWFIQYLEHLVVDYSLETLLAEVHVDDTLLPPSILIFPGTFDSVKEGSFDQVYPQIAPILITWLRIRTHYPWLHLKESYPLTPGPPNHSNESTGSTSAYDLGSLFSQSPALSRMFGEYARCPYQKLKELPRRLPTPMSIQKGQEINPHTSFDTKLPTPPSVYFGTIEPTPIFDTVESNLKVETSETTTVLPMTEDSEEFEENTQQESEEISSEKDFDLKESESTSYPTILPTDSLTNPHKDQEFLNQEIETFLNELSNMPASTTPAPDVKTTITTLHPRYLTRLTPPTVPYRFGFESMKTAFDEAFKKIRNSFQG